MSYRGGRLLTGLTSLVLLFLAAGCGAENKAATIPQKDAAEAIRSRLESAGVEVAWLTPSPGARQSDFFGPDAHLANLSVGGPDGSYVQLYRFPEAGQAAEAAAGVSRDGSSVPTGDGIAQVSWVGPPHFFRKCRLIAVFVEGAGGDAGSARDRLVLEVLRDVLGPQFAGASASPK